MDSSSSDWDQEFQVTKPQNAAPSSVVITGLVANALDEVENWDDDFDFPPPNKNKNDGVFLMQQTYRPVKKKSKQRPGKASPPKSGTKDANAADAPADALKPTIRRHLTMKALNESETKWLPVIRTALGQLPGICIYFSVLYLKTYRCYYLLRRTSKGHPP